MKNVSKLLVACVAVAATMPAADAIPARKKAVAVTAENGVELMLTPHGDETFHYYTDGAGRRYLPDATGRAVEATDARIAERFAATAPLRAKRRSWSSPTYPRTGSPRVPVILVQFADRAFSFDADAFRRMMNEPGYSDYGAGGSAADYFAENSCGVFTPQFDVYGPVTLSGKVADYGTNDAYGNDALAHTMVVEACRALDAEVDFSQYDEDGDGMADIVYVYYAGYGENDGGASTTVWPHTSSLSAKGTSLTLDGVSINSYSCSNELQNGYGRTLTGIGTFCHEYTHVLGFPDLYATVNTDRDCWTPDAWTLMDQGSYNNSSRTPAAYTAYERMSMGWLVPTDATGDALAQLPSIAANRALKVATSESDTEYFLIEYRARTGWDAYVPGEGLLVWHIDYDDNIWNANTVNNNPDHLRVRLIPADGLWKDNERPGIAFRSGDIALTPWIGTAAATLAVGQAPAGYMGVKINGGRAALAVPAGLAPTEVRDKEATFEWDAVEGASGYMVTVTDEWGSPVAGMTNMLTAATRLTVAGLQPSTGYAVKVAATAGASMGADCAAAEFTTDEPGLSFTRPDAPTISGVTGTSFEISWAAHPGAERYLLNAWRVVDGDDEAEVCDFSDGLDLPEGWTTTCTSTFAVASYCGASKPSLVMANNGEYLQSPACAADIRTLSFYTRGRNTDSGAKLRIETLRDGSWTQFKTIDVSADASTPTFDLSGGCKGVRITFVNPSARGTVMIDDVALGFGKKQVNEYALRDHEVKDATSYTLGNLRTGSEYFVTLRAADSHDVSLESEAARVTTDGSLGIVSAETATGDVTVTDLAGRVVATGAPGVERSLPAGIYIVKSKGSVQKTIIF